MRDDRPLLVFASRAAHILGVCVVSEHPDFPADPAFRAIRTPAGMVRASDGAPIAIWLELTRECGPWELAARDGKGYRRAVVSGRTAGDFRKAFDAWEEGRNAEASIRRHRENR